MCSSEEIFFDGAVRGFNRVLFGYCFTHSRAILNEFTHQYKARCSWSHNTGVDGQKVYHATVDLRVYRFCQPTCKQYQCTHLSFKTKTIVINDIYAEIALSQYLSAHIVPGPCGWISDSLYDCGMKYGDHLDKSVRKKVFLSWLRAMN